MQRRTKKMPLRQRLRKHLGSIRSRWLRLIITSLTRLIADHGMANGKKCLFILDEAAALGHMPCLDQGLQMLRSYGARLCFVWQSMAQLKAVFKDKESVLLDNTEHIFFGTNSLTTAQFVSQSLGNASVVVESANTGDGANWGGGQATQPNNTGYNRSFGRSFTEKERLLLTPDEVLQLDPGLVVIFLRGLRPLLCKRIIWYTDRYFYGSRLPLVWWLLLTAAMGLIAWALFKSPV
jgi:type IV secretion system protein VirD4